MQERREDYPKIYETLAVIENEISHVKERLSEYEESKDKHRERLVALQGYKDHFEEMFKEYTGNTKQIEVLIAGMAQDVKHMVKSFDQHLLDDRELGTRVSALEKNISWWGGGLACLVCIVGFIISIVK